MASSHQQIKGILHTKKRTWLLSAFLKCESLETSTQIKRSFLEQFRRGFFCPGSLSNSLHPCKFRLLLSNFSHEMLVLRYAIHLFIWLPGHLNSFSFADLIQSPSGFLMNLLNYSHWIYFTTTQLFASFHNLLLLHRYLCSFLISLNIIDMRT